jgi:hypothetical protein
MNNTTSPRRQSPNGAPRPLRYALGYRRIGWLGTLPLNGKVLLVRGITGRDGRDATDLEVRRMYRRWPSANLGLRLPRSVVGLDVDGYHDGGSTLGALEAELGALPETWRPTARMPGDAFSGIYLYQVPEDAELAASAGTGIDVIQWFHRYIVAPPSIHPDTGRQYRWWRGAETAGVPRPESLPALPARWLESLSAPRSATGSMPSSLEEAREWYGRRAGGAPCDFMAERTEAALGELADAAEGCGLHDTMVRVALRLCRWAAEGHPGLDLCLADVRAVVVSADRPRRDLQGEWRRALGGAAALVAGDDVGDDDPCVELEGLS